MSRLCRSCDCGFEFRAQKAESGTVSQSPWTKKDTKRELVEMTAGEKLKPDIQGRLVIPAALLLLNAGARGKKRPREAKGKCTIRNCGEERKKERKKKKTPIHRD